MDLNKLLHDHQIAKFGQTQATTRTARADHSDAMTLLATRIRTLREQAGVDVSAAPFVAGEPIADYRHR